MSRAKPATDPDSGDFHRLDGEALQDLHHFQVEAAALPFRRMCDVYFPHEERVRAPLPPSSRASPADANLNSRSLDLARGHGSVRVVLVG